MKICFVVNPIAGIGGRIGLKGSDNLCYYSIKEYAFPLSPIKCRRFLKCINRKILGDIVFLTASGEMGEQYLSESGLKFEIVYTPKKHTDRTDTINTVKECIEKNCELIVFVGGDGTARDVLVATKNIVPIIGVPAGVKVYSGVFGFTPQDSARLIEKYVLGEAQIVEREIIDADEEMLRKGIIRLKVFGYSKTISFPGFLQPTKTSFHGITEEENRLSIAKYVAENLEDGVLYILGPGSTVKKICEYLGLRKDELSVDLYTNKRIIARNVDEKTILEYIKRFKKVKIIVTPIGRQGFIFGRGNQEISPLVLEKVDKEDIIVVSTKQKLMETPFLRVDTGDEKIDNKFKGYMRVVVDYNEEKIVRVK